MSRFTVPAVLIAGVLAVGCAGTYTSDGVYAEAYIEPDLAYVSPGVSVVADYEEPVFYSDNYYWRYDNYGRWYRSPYYNRGWVYGQPPAAVLGIRSPYSYRNYRPHGYTAQRGYNGRYYDHRGQVHDRGSYNNPRDHRR